MNKIFKLVAVVTTALLISGCISAKSATTDFATRGSGFVASGMTVVAGDSLWSISANAEVYASPERWPLIYKANIDIIDDADLIFPGQVLYIPYNASHSAVMGAVAHARYRGAWSLGEIEVSDIKYQKTE